MFLDDSDIKKALAGLLKQRQADMEPYWDQIISDSHESAYNEIVTRFVGRGFTLGQVEGWDRGAEFEKCLALWWCLDRGAGLHEFNDKFVSKLDRRGELDAIQLIVGGVLQAPEGTTGRPVSPPTNQGGTGEIGFGVQDTTNDEFTMQGFIPPLQRVPNRQTW